MFYKNIQKIKVARFYGPQCIFRHIYTYREIDEQDSYCRPIGQLNINPKIRSREATSSKEHCCELLQPNVVNIGEPKCQGQWCEQKFSQGQELLFCPQGTSRPKLWSSCLFPNSIRATLTNGFVADFVATNSTCRDGLKTRNSRVTFPFHGPLPRLLPKLPCRA